MGHLEYRRTDCPIAAPLSNTHVFVRIALAMVPLGAPLLLASWPLFVTILASSLAIIVFLCLNPRSASLLAVAGILAAVSTLICIGPRNALAESKEFVDVRVMLRELAIQCRSSAASNGNVWPESLSQFEGVSKRQSNGRWTLTKGRTSVDVDYLVAGVVVESDTTIVMRGYPSISKVLSFAECRADGLVVWRR